MKGRFSFPGRIRHRFRGLPEVVRDDLAEPDAGRRDSNERTSTNG
jgi:hypothetical protein